MTLCDLMECSLPGFSVHGISHTSGKCWSGLPFPTPGDLPDPGFESASLVSLTLADGFFTIALPGKPMDSLLSQFSLSFMSNSAALWTVARQSSLAFTNLQSLLKCMSIESVIPSGHLILCRPLFLLQSFLALGSFPKSHFFPSGGQSVGVSASTSVLPMNIPMNIQD